MSNKPDINQQLVNFLYRGPFLVQHHLRWCTESIVGNERENRNGSETGSQCVRCRVG